MVGSRAAAHLYRGRPDWTVMDGLGQGLGKPCPEGSARVQRAPLVSRGSAPCRRLGWMGTQNVTQEVSVGGGSPHCSLLTLPHITCVCAP